MRIEDLDTPVLLVDIAAMERNIARMAALCREAGVALRPHAKAHKSPDIAAMQIEAGAVGICCAKLGEAEVMAHGGIADILITTPVIGVSKLMRLVQIAGQARVAVVADDAGNIGEMAQMAQTAGVKLDVVVEVDVGQRRCGVQPGEPALMLAQQIRGAEWLNFRGLQGYQGRIQMTAGYAERKEAADAATALLVGTAELIRASGIEVPVLTGGGSGTSVIDAAAGGLTELQPGGYLFMDSRYAAIEWNDGNRVPFETSLSVLATVVSRPDANRAIVDMGHKAMTSDGGPPVPVDLPGAAFAYGGEEHGELNWGGPCPLAIGDKVLFRPAHCDTAVNLYDMFIATRDGEVEGVIEIAARGRTQ
jgi:D-serine deaminase-like pyridoxal phosphate-dependent protein